MQSLICITNGEQEIKKVIAIMPNGKTGTPCGACHEFMVQLMSHDYSKIKIMIEYENKKLLPLKNLYLNGGYKQLQVCRGVENWKGVMDYENANRKY